MSKYRHKLCSNQLNIWTSEVQSSKLSGPCWHSSVTWSWMTRLSSGPLDAGSVRLSAMTVPAGLFLQRGRIACNVQRCNTYSNSVCPSVTRWYTIQKNEDRMMRSSLWGSKNTGFLILTMVWGDVPFHLAISNLASSWGLPRPIIKSHEGKMEAGT